MAYFIFTKNSDDIEGTIYKIAENESDLNNLNIIKSDYKIIEDSQSNFDLVKYGNKLPSKYNNDIITYVDTEINFIDLIATDIKTGEQILVKPAKNYLKEYIEIFKKKIKSFINNNKNHVLFNKWDNYYSQLDNLNLDSITYPLNKSLEQYFKDQNQVSLNPLQIP
jgi:hypothetical protein